MRKIFYYLCLAILFLLPLGVYAEDLEVAFDGWEGVGEVEVQIIRGKFTLAEAMKTGEIQLNGDFLNETNRAYSASEYTDGTFDRERDENKLSYTYITRNVPFIAYKHSNGPLEAGEHQIDGSIKVLFKDAAILQNGDICDLEMTIDNIKLNNSITSNKPLLIAYDGKINVAVAAEFASEERAAAELNQETHRVPDAVLGAQYDLSFRVLKDGNVISKNMGISFVDIDTTDSTPAGNHTYVDGNGKPQPYAETITFIQGVADRVHLLPETMTTLVPKDTEFGRKTQYVGKAEDEVTKKSGLITLANSSNFKFRWTGSDCVTNIGFINTFLIKTDTYGDYKDNGSITNSDTNEMQNILWKSSKTITMTPNSGYYVDKITIEYYENENSIEIDYHNLPLNNGKRTYTKDGVTYTFTETNGTVTYSFDSITDDHSIEVSFMPDDGGYLFHYDAGGGVGHMDDTIAQFDVKGNISKNTFTRDGYAFVGWKAYCDDGNGNLVEHKDSNGKVITFNDQDEYLNLYCENKREVTLVAQWINNPKTGTFITIATVFLMLVASVVAFMFYSKRKTSTNNSL